MTSLIRRSTGPTFGNGRLGGVFHIVAAVEANYLVV